MVPIAGMVGPGAEEMGSTEANGYVREVNITTLIIIQLVQK